MRRKSTTAGGLVAALTIGLAVLAGASPGYAADAGLGVTVRATDPLAPVVTLTNRGAEPCQVATTALGTVAVTAMSQDGKPVVPDAFVPGFDEPLATVVAQRLRILQPGESVDVPLQGVPTGPTGHAIEIVADTGTVAPAGLRYPVRAGVPLHLEVAYGWRVAPASGPPMCAQAGASTVVGGGPAPAGDGLPSWLLWAAVAAVVLLVLVVVAVLLRRRRRSAAAAALILLAALTVPGWHARPARANVQVADPSLQAPYDECLALFQQPGHDPAGILPTVLGPGITVILEVPVDGVNHEGGASTELMVIYWNPEDRHPYGGHGGNADPCTSLYHEMFHAWEDSQGIQDPHECVTAGEHHTGIGINEVNATRAQNLLRRALGMPERDQYGSNPLPTSPCRDSRPTDPVCNEDGCGASSGEPHLTTLDGRYYDFQGAGEFVALRDPSGGFAVQVRQQPYRDSRTVAVNTSVAVDVAGDRVQTDLTGTGIAVLVNGEPRTDSLSSLGHGGQVRIGQGDAGEMSTVIWPDGSTVWVTAVAGMGLNLSVQPSPARGPRLEGLLGSADGKPANDIRVRGGAAVDGEGQLPYEKLYPAFADSWRIEDAGSLFTYPAGRTTASYTDRAFPDRAEAGPAPDTAAATVICAKAGVVAPVSLANCVFDVSRTGVAAFATSALAAQAFTAGTKPGATVPVPATADIYLAGSGAVDSLPGGAGTRPLRLAFDPGARQISFALVAGELGAAGAEPSDGPDGGTGYAGTAVTAFNGISGVVHQSRSLFLVGVFLPDGSTGNGSGQPDVTGQNDQTDVTTALGVLFAIGDGRTAGGAVQHFTVPAGATRLYVGFADASSFHGDPGSYDDNTGGLVVRLAS